MLLRRSLSGGGPARRFASSAAASSSAGEEAPPKKTGLKMERRGNPFAAANNDATWSESSTTGLGGFTSKWRAVKKANEGKRTPASEMNTIKELLLNKQAKSANKGEAASSAQPKLFTVDKWRNTYKNASIVPPSVPTARVSAPTKLDAKAPVYHAPRMESRVAVRDGSKGPSHTVGGRPLRRTERPLQEIGTLQDMLVSGLTTRTPRVHLRPKQIGGRTQEEIARGEQETLAMISDPSRVYCLQIQKDMLEAQLEQMQAQAKESAGWRGRFQDPDAIPVPKELRILRCMTPHELTDPLGHVHAVLRKKALALQSKQSVEDVFSFLTMQQHLGVMSDFIHAKRRVNPEFKIPDRLESVKLMMTSEGFLPNTGRMPGGYVKAMKTEQRLKTLSKKRDTVELGRVKMLNERLARREYEQMVQQLSA